MPAPKTVDEYVTRHDEWWEELNKLRSILQSTPLVESIKWGFPVYTLNNKNVLGLGAFKSYVGIWFFQGGLLKDPHQLLVNAQEGKTKAMRQLRFSSLEEMNEKIIRDYVAEAIENQKKGKEIKPDLKKPLVIPDELKLAFETNQEVRDQFEKLNLTSKREFSEYIESAKREDTKKSRLEKIIPMILEGVGLHDKYKKGT